MQCSLKLVIWSVRNKKCLLDQKRFFWRSLKKIMSSQEEDISFCLSLPSSLKYVSDTAPLLFSNVNLFEHEPTLYIFLIDNEQFLCSSLLSLVILLSIIFYINKQTHKPNSDNQNQRFKRFIGLVSDDMHWKKGTFKLGCNKQSGIEQICLWKPGFVKTVSICAVNGCLGLNVH